MRYKSIEDFIRNNKSTPCSLVSRNYEIFKARDSGMTLQQIAIRFNISRQQVINILLTK